MRSFIIDIIFIILMVIGLILEIISQSWLLVILSAIIIVIGIVNAILSYKAIKHKKITNNNENIKE